MLVARTIKEDLATNLMAYQLAWKKAKSNRDAAKRNILNKHGKRTTNETHVEKWEGIMNYYEKIIHTIQQHPVPETA